MNVLLGIRPCRAGDVDAVRGLLREYQADIGVDLCFQGFDAELAGLPGAYVEPKGLLLCAEAEGHPVGCIALRPVDGETAEMKRLFVRPTHRGKGLARALVVELIRRSRDLGYSRICLDTLPGMERAQALYASLGFRDIPAYIHNPVAGTRYMGLSL